MCDFLQSPIFTDGVSEYLQFKSGDDGTNFLCDGLAQITNPENDTAINFIFDF